MTAETQPQRPNDRETEIVNGNVIERCPECGYKFVPEFGPCRHLWREINGRNPL